MDRIISAPYSSTATSVLVVIKKAYEPSAGFFWNGSEWSASYATVSAAWDSDINHFYWPTDINETYPTEPFVYSMSAEEFGFFYGGYHKREFIDGSSITNVSATIDPTLVASAITGAVISGIGAWGDLRWSKIYGIPLEQWDAIVDTVD